MIIFGLTNSFLFLTRIHTISGTANNSYANCVQVAAHFATTVSNGPVANIVTTTGVNVTCPQLTGALCHGSVIHRTCLL